MMVTRSGSSPFPYGSFYQPEKPERVTIPEALATNQGHIEMEHHRG